MTKDLAPHGTVAAARRHQRAKDPLCDECTVAMRDYRRNYRNGTRAEVERVPVDDAPVFTLPSELEETRSNYVAVVAAMTSASTPATALSSLSARRQALYERLVVLEEQELHRQIIANISDGGRAAEAVRAAGGSPLDVLIARTSAGKVPLKHRAAEDEPTDPDDD